LESDDNYDIINQTQFYPFTAGMLNYS